MPKIVPKNDLSNYVGKHLGYSDWLTIDQDRINRFADATLDHQFIHVDVERAEATPFGSTIAHGFLILSLLPHLASQVALLPEGLDMAINYGLNKVRFASPVKVNAAVRVGVKVLDVSERSPGQFLVRSEATIEIKGGDRPALIAESLILYVTK